MLEPAASPAGFTVRCTRTLLSPWSRLSLLVVMLAAAVTTVLVFEPQRLLSAGWPPQLSGAAAVVLFGLAYGLCTAAFVPRPILNLAAGALFGSQAGLVSAVAGTVVGAGIAFARPGRWARRRCVRCCAGGCCSRRTAS